MIDRLRTIATRRNLSRSLFFMLTMLVLMNLAAALFSRSTNGWLSSTWPSATRRKGPTA